MGNLKYFPHNGLICHNENNERVIVETKNAQPGPFFSTLMNFSTISRGKKSIPAFNSVAFIKFERRERNVRTYFVN